MISVTDLSICQGDFSLSKIELEIPENAYAILMGTTGTGKTTLLEVLCGLRPVRSGKILVNGHDITATPPHQREIGYVPQDAALFPSMRIDHQIAFSLDVRKSSRKATADRVDELAELTNISHLLRRYPRGLSGGEKQRVALARALAFRPQCLCLDEPLAALDDHTRKQLATLLKRVHREQDVTVVHVTHNSAEALELGTHRFRLEDGIVKTNHE